MSDLLVDVAEEKTAKNRLHLDVQVGGGRAEPQDVRWARITERVDRLWRPGRA